MLRSITEGGIHYYSVIFFHCVICKKIVIHNAKIFSFKNVLQVLICFYTINIKLIILLTIIFIPNYSRQYNPNIIILFPRY